MMNVKNALVCSAVGVSLMQSVKMHQTKRDLVFLSKGDSFVVSL